eukprot:12784911-Alexandrium_andersonii.AAC.1
MRIDGLAALRPCDPLQDSTPLLRTSAQDSLLALVHGPPTTTKATGWHSGHYLLGREMAVELNPDCMDSFA